jgi:serine/threonine protein phosphatase PrpC
MDFAEKSGEGSAAATRGPTHVQVRVVALSDIGRRRPNNEDSYLIFDLGARALHPEEVEVELDLTPPGLLLAVADGMGGHQSGQVASQLCTETLTGEFLRALDRWESDPQIEWERVLTDAVEAANRDVLEAGQRSPDHYGMGTTLTAALMSEGHVLVAQVGDSRAYLLHQGSLVQLTRDQTIGNSMLAAHQGVKTDSRFAEMLVQAVGAVDKLDVAVTSAGLEPGDSLLICCDGLYKVVEHGAITEVLRSSRTPMEKARELIARANAAGGPDNITVVLSETRAALWRAGSPERGASLWQS